MIAVVADDYTGGTDVAAELQRNGLRTLLYFGVPPDGAEMADHDAVVVALKTRTTPRQEAVERSIAAVEWMRARGEERFYFKFCSTFDSTRAGNIGPVLDALCDALGVPSVLLTPSSPEHHRTQYRGHLFVDDVLLSESHMRDHPLTPMHDSYLPRVLQQQTRRRVGLIPHEVVQAGSDAVRSALAEAEGAGDRYVLADAIDSRSLDTLGRAVVSCRLSAGAAGLAGGLARALAEESPGRAPGVRGLGSVAPPDSRTVVLSSSCSTHTLEQNQRMIESGRPAHKLDVLVHQDSGILTQAALDWFDAQSADKAPLIYSSVGPAELAEVQRQVGRDHAAAIIEQTMGAAASALADRGVRRFVVAGGETSGAVVAALGIAGGLVGREAARGVPWIHALGGSGVAVLLKSGAFGDPDFLVHASQTSPHLD